MRGKKKEKREKENARKSHLASVIGSYLDISITRYKRPRAVINSTIRRIFCAAS